MTLKQPFGYLMLSNNVNSFNSLPNLKILNNITEDLPSSQIKIWGKSVKGFLSSDRTSKNKQTEITTLCI